MISAPDNSSLSSDKDTNQFLVQTELNFKSLIQLSKTLLVKLTRIYRTFSQLLYFSEQQKLSWTWRVLGYTACRDLTFNDQRYGESPKDMGQIKSFTLLQKAHQANRWVTLFPFLLTKKKLNNVALLESYIDCFEMLCLYNVTVLLLIF